MKLPLGQILRDKQTKLAKTLNLQSESNNYKTLQLSIYNVHCTYTIVHISTYTVYIGHIDAKSILSEISNLKLAQRRPISVDQINFV